MQYIKILGTAQDGGFPHPGCFQNCCSKAWNNPSQKRLVSSVAIIDDNLKKIWLFDISPDINSQLHMIGENYSIEGIFLTHAHYGHYSGIYQLGKEVMNLKNIPIYAMPLMKEFLQKNESVNFLINNKNIFIENLSEENSILINGSTSVVPFDVPHRNEMSETVGFKIVLSNKSFIYLPDIDTWEEWDCNLKEFIKSHDILFLDGTFFRNDEIKSRNIKNIPHPPIEKTIKILNDLELAQRKKIFFTHLNHTNSVLDKTSNEYRGLIDLGFNVAEDGQEFSF